LSAVTPLLGLLLFAGCRQAAPPPVGLRIATTTSYLEAAARDLLGDQLSVVRLAEPGTCPGHFDLRPSQVAELRRCRILLRFDFQQALDAKLAGLGTNPPRLAPVSLKGGMCRPDSYLAACRQVAQHLVALDLLSATQSEARLQAITARLEALSRETSSRVAQARLVGRPVIASGHQRDFCEWLGLQVVATFRAADTASIGEIEAALDAGRLGQVHLVVANLPEGRRTADALADRLKGRVVVFENFPALRHGTVFFDAMLEANLEALLQAGAP
jgi:zinc transport system substrate-binding protein